jgi:hypothetical protein
MFKHNNVKVIGKMCRKPVFNLKLEGILFQIFLNAGKCLTQLVSMMLCACESPTVLVLLWSDSRMQIKSISRAACGHSS